MIFSQKAKCSGCLCLIKGVDEKGKEILACSLAYPVKFKRVGGEPVQPVPKKKCYKPTTKEEVKKAEELTDKRRNA